MSYDFEMHFWSAASLGSAMRKAQEIVDAISSPQKMQEMIKDNIYYMPSLHLHVKAENWNMAVEADKNWLYRLFNYRFLFWEKYHLLGLIGDFPQETLKGAKTILFQNASDQNYSFDTWPTKIHFFKERINRFRSLLELPPEETMKTLCDEKFISKTDFQEVLEEKELDKEVAEYYVLVSLYKDIFDSLALNDWMWGVENDVFKRFTLNAIHSAEERYLLERYLRKLLISQAGNLSNKQTMYFPLVLSTQENPSAATLLFKQEYDYYEGPTMNCEKAEETVRKVVEKYLESEDGKRFTENKERPTWMELVAAIPARMFKEEGLELVKRDNYCDAVVLDAEGSPEDFIR